MGATVDPYTGRVSVPNGTSAGMTVVPGAVSKPKSDPYAGAPAYAQPGWRNPNAPIPGAPAYAQPGWRPPVTTSTPAPRNTSGAPAYAQPGWQRTPEAQASYEEAQEKANATGGGHTHSGGGTGSSTTRQPSGPSQAQINAANKGKFYEEYRIATEQAKAGDPTKLKSLDAFFKISRDPNEYKKAFYADYSSDKLSSSTENEIRNWFAGQDANNDGMIQTSEMTASAKSQVGAYAGSDNVLSSQEGVSYHVGKIGGMDAKLDASGLPESSKREIRSWFIGQDKNNDGKVSSSEMGAPALATNTAAGYMGDGSLSLDEAIAYHKGKQAATPVAIGKVTDTAAGPPTDSSQNSGQNPHYSDTVNKIIKAADEAGLRPGAGRSAVPQAGINNPATPQNNPNGRPEIDDSQDPGTVINPNMPNGSVNGSSSDNSVGSNAGRGNSSESDLTHEEQKAAHLEEVEQKKEELRAAQQAHQEEIERKNALASSALAQRRNADEVRMKKIMDQRSAWGGASASSGADSLAAPVITPVSHAHGAAGLPGGR